MSGMYACEQSSMLERSSHTYPKSVIRNNTLIGIANQPRGAIDMP